MNQIKCLKRNVIFHLIIVKATGSHWRGANEPCAALEPQVADSCPNPTLKGVLGGGFLKLFDHLRNRPDGVYLSLKTLMCFSSSPLVSFS